MEKGQLGVIILVTVVIAVIVSIITSSITGNVVKVPTSTSTSQSTVYTTAEVDAKLAAINVSLGAKGYALLSNTKSAPETSVSVTCPTGKKVLGGGCLAAIGIVNDSTTKPNYLVASYPPLNYFWECRWNAPTRGNITAFAICANIV